MDSEASVLVGAGCGVGGVGVLVPVGIGNCVLTSAPGEDVGKAVAAGAAIRITAVAKPSAPDLRLRRIAYLFTGRLPFTVGQAVRWRDEASGHFASRALVRMNRLNNIRAP